ncbi:MULTISPECIES: Lrp/AsnC family transcriptional regulator [unclassified Plantactinospora]|uniref:Lrp/AsnC family transcriptional regulator n=1 Tax=unclassified Plantactinospora TaxID=2631981 RepID=UPI000D17933E|nr:MULTISPECIES: Lrp/AsnC family transcriptional regulator [unclassified Plantactinospora]AVT34929.1 AsnC family transcriptional regulator [Plantactinospora sp. BC1]AVT42095.1 AsnC family transcriptional regulator [Plantactinospora sp. BB1]
MASYDSTDRAILDRLQTDGRIANVDLAEAVALSPSACLRRVRALEQDGLIAGYRAELDRARLGLDLTVFIELKVGQHSRETAARIESVLSGIPEVVACHVISGSADFLVEAAVANLAAYERLLIDQILVIPAIVDARSTFAIRTVKTRGPLPLSQLR